MFDLWTKTPWSLTFSENTAIYKLIERYSQSVRTQEEVYSYDQRNHDQFSELLYTEYENADEVEAEAVLRELQSWWSRQ